MGRSTAEPGPGLYAPGDVLWTINRETVLLLAGPRALLMQLAHPLVAAGVADHSDFRSDPLGRLRGTLDAMLGILFGSREEAGRQAARVNAAHERVQGRLRRDTPGFPAGTPYDALDPELLFWVQATLQDSAVAAFEHFVRPLSAGERVRQLAESRRMAPLFRLPPERLPDDPAAFEAEMARRLASRELEPTPEARELADAVLHPPLPGLPRWLADLGGDLPVGLVPPELRRRYGIPWSSARERRFRALSAAVRAVRPWLPEPLRVMPHARRAERRARGT